MALAFDYEGRFNSGLQISVSSQTWTPQSNNYRTKLPAEKLSETGSVQLTLDQFKSDDGSVPSAWSALDTIQIEGGAAAEPTPVFRRFRWERRR
jgi:hypothetical protein